MQNKKRKSSKFYEIKIFDVIELKKVLEFLDEKILENEKLKNISSTDLSMAMLIISNISRMKDEMNAINQYISLSKLNKKDKFSILDRFDEYVIEKAIEYYNTNSLEKRFDM